MVIKPRWRFPKQNDLVRSSTMDVMKPALINIGGRCYRKMPFEQRIEHRDSLEEDCYSGKSS